MDGLNVLLIFAILGYGWANIELKKKVKELEEMLEKERQEKEKP